MINISKHFQLVLEITGFSSVLKLKLICNNLFQGTKPKNRWKTSLLLWLLVVVFMNIPGMNATDTGKLVGKCLIFKHF